MKKYIVLGLAIIVIISLMFFYYPTFSIRASLYQERNNLFDIDGVNYLKSVENPPRIIVGVTHMRNVDDIPEEINGFPVEVVLDEPFTLFSNPYCADDCPECPTDEWLDTYNRPLTAGQRIEIVDLDTDDHNGCTLGAIVYDNSAGEHMVLTANHCVGETRYGGADDIGNPVYQPGSDQGLFGEVFKVSPTSPPTDDHIDAALISLEYDSDYTTNTYRNGGHIVAFGDQSDIQLGNTGWKLGQGTGFTNGTIESIDFYLHPDDNVTMHGYEICRPYCRDCDPPDFFGGAGDSGAGIVSEDTPYKLIGILTGGNGRCGFSNYPWDIQSAMGISIVPTQSYCGDGACDLGEDIINCPEDCEDTPLSCGDGVCDPGENYLNCPSDCESPGSTQIPAELFVVLIPIVLIGGALAYRRFR